MNWICLIETDGTEYDIVPICHEDGSAMLWCDFKSVQKSLRGHPLIRQNKYWLIDLDNFDSADLGSKPPRMSAAMSALQELTEAVLTRNDKDYGRCLAEAARVLEPSGWTPPAPFLAPHDRATAIPEE
jgi:hypothetical protein